MHGKEQEISQQPSSSESFSQSHNRFEALMNNSSDSIIVHDLEGNILEWNMGAERLYGYTREEACKMNIFNLTDPEFLEEQQKHFDSLDANPQSSIDFETHRKSKDGSIKEVWLTATKLHEKPADVILTTGQDFTKLAGSITLVERDITERRKLEKEMQFERTLLRASLESSQDGILVFDEKGKVISHNLRFNEMWGIPIDVIKMDSSDILQKMLLEKFAKPDKFESKLQYFLDHPTEKSREDFYLNDGRIFDHYTAPVIDSNHIYHGRIWFFHDVTTRRTAENHLRKSLIGITEVISQIVEMRDPYTSGHQKKVSRLARKIGQNLELSQEMVENLRMCALIHDIGKMAIPSDILTKPVKLSPIEYELIKAHSQLGFLALKDSGLPETISQAVLQHHERLDGSGYPKGLKGDEIGIEAKILGVADTVEAMSSHRPYRPALGIDEALAEISKNKGILYDPVVVDACLNIFKEGFDFDL